MQRLMNLNLVPRKGAMEPDVNPCTRASIKLYKEVLNLGDPLTGDELEIFKAQFKTLLAGPGSEERRIQLDRIAAYVTGLRAIKHELGNMAFAGLNPEDTELGFGHIRPVFLKANAPAAILLTSRTTWAEAYVGTAYIDWIMDGTAAAMTLGDSFGLIITHVMSLVTPLPFTAEIRFTAGRTGVMIPVDVRALAVADNINGVAIVPVPTIIAKPKSTLYGEARPDTVPGTDELCIRGLVVGLGRALRAISPVYPAA